jgi:hypothetical protein
VGGYGKQIITNGRKRNPDIFNALVLKVEDLF